MPVSSEQLTKEAMTRAVDRGCNSSEKRYIRKLKKMTATELKAEYKKLESAPAKKKWWVDYRRQLFVAIELDDRGYTETQEVVWRKK
jgi:hypothetical protein